MSDHMPRRDIEAPFDDANGFRHPGWRRAEVVLGGRLWGSGMEGVLPAAAEALRRGSKGSGTSWSA